MIHRRSFLERLGLGAGGLLLSPIAQSLVSEARGQVAPRKRFIVFIHGNGLHLRNFTPPEFQVPGDSAPAVLDGRKDFTWPSMYRALAPWRNRMLLVDGLTNNPVSGTSGHGTGCSALSGFAAANGGSNENPAAAPGGVTIDQYIAAKLGASTRCRSVLFGASSVPTPQHTMSFASAPGVAEPFFQSPRMMYADLFGELATDANGVRSGAYRKRLLLDQMRKDIKRVSAALAGPEKQKLDQYLAGVADAEKRMQELDGLSCKPGVFDEAATTVEDRLESMTEMATLALTCGMTNVVGISVGCGNPHGYFPTYRRLHVGTRFAADGGIPFHGHSTDDVLIAAWEILHDFHFTLLARMITALQNIKEGDRTAFDNTVILYLSDNGHAHHNVYHERFPLVIIGDAGGKLRADGRYLRYALTRRGPNRPLVDLYSTLATACGIPTDAFGKGGNSVPRGPLGELLA